MRRCDICLSLNELSAGNSNCLKTGLLIDIGPTDLLTGSMNVWSV